MTDRADYANIPYARKDCSNALADYISILSGRSPADPDPVAEVLALRSRVSPMEVIAHIGGFVFDRGDPAMLTRIFGSSDIGDALEHALTRVAGIAYVEQAAEMAPVFFDAPTRGIRAADLPLIDLGELQRVTAGGAPIPLPLNTVTAATVEKPAHFAARFLITRELVLAEELDLIDHAVRQLAGMAARIESRLAGQALDAASIVTTTEVGLTVASIGEALGRLRTRTTAAGSVANLRGYYLVVPPAKEAAALVIGETMGGARLSVIPNAWLGTASYLLCPPAQSPVLARPRPIGLDGLPSVSKTRAVQRDAITGEESHFDGMALRVDAYIGASVVDTTGVIEIPAA
jgi:hypothetical protein